MALQKNNFSGSKKLFFFPYCSHETQTSPALQKKWMQKKNVASVEQELDGLANAQAQQVANSPPMLLLVQVLLQE